MQIVSPYSFLRLLAARCVVLASCLVIGLNQWAVTPQDQRKTFLLRRFRLLRLILALCLFYFFVLFFLFSADHLSLRSFVLLCLPSCALSFVVEVTVELASPRRSSLRWAIYFSRMTNPFIRAYIRELYGPADDLPQTLYECFLRETAGTLSPLQKDSQ